MVRSRKNTEVVVCLWVGRGAGVDGAAPSAATCVLCPNGWASRHEDGLNDWNGALTDFGEHSSLGRRKVCGNIMGLRSGPARCERPPWNMRTGHGKSCRKNIGGLFEFCQRWAQEYDCRGGRDDDLHGEAGTTERKRPREGDEVGRGPSQEQCHDSVCSHLGSVEETGRRWGHCTRQAGWGLEQPIHAVGDEPIGSGVRAGSIPQARNLVRLLSCQRASRRSRNNVPEPPTRSFGVGRNRSDRGAAAQQVLAGHPSGTGRQWSRRTMASL